MGLKPGDYPEEVKTYVEAHLEHDWPAEVLRWNHADWIRTGRGSFVRPEWAVAMQYCDAIDLSGKDLDNKRMTSLAKKTMDWSRVRVLNLSQNMISRSGLRDLVEAMNPDSLELLDMRQNYFSSGMVNDYEALLRKAPHLKRVNLEQPHYEDSITLSATAALGELSMTYGVTFAM